MKGKEQRLKILVTDGGAANALGIVRQLGKLKRFEIFLVGSNNFAPAKYSKYCASYFNVVHPKNDAHKFTKQLLKLIQDHKIDFLMPVGFYSHKAVIDFENEFKFVTKVCLPSKQSFDIATSKVLTGQKAVEAGVLVPKTISVKDLTDLDTLSTISYPVVIKSQKEIGGRMVEYADSKEELIRKFRHLVSVNNLTVDNFPIIQEYIHGAGVGFFGFYKEGELLAFFMHERIREFPVSGGRSVCARSISDENLLKSGKAVLDALKWNGCAMVEFKKTSDGRFYLLEVNPKLWGSLELAICSGVNFPLLMIDNAFDSQHVLPKNYKIGLYFQWILNGEVYHLLHRPWKLFRIVGTAFSSQKDFWISDIKPNLMQGLLMFVDLYKVLKGRKKS